MTATVPEQWTDPALDCEPGDCTPFPRFEILKDAQGDPVVVDHERKVGYPFLAGLSTGEFCLEELRTTGMSDYLSAPWAYEAAVEANIERGRE